MTPHFLRMDFPEMNRKRPTFSFPALITSVSMAVVLVGCAREERVLDVEGPNGSIEVDRNLDTGAVDVDVDRDE